MKLKVVQILIPESIYPVRLTGYFLIFYFVEGSSQKQEGSNLFAGGSHLNPLNFHAVFKRKKIKAPGNSKCAKSLYFLRFSRYSIPALCIILAIFISVKWRMF